MNIKKSSDHFTEEVALHLMQLIEKEPTLSQRELSKEMGVALGKVNYCISGLVEKGFVKLENFRGAKNHLRYAYILTPGGIEEKLRLTYSFLKRRIREYSEIKAQIESLSDELAQNNPSLLKKLKFDLNVIQKAEL